MLSLLAILAQPAHGADARLTKGGDVLAPCLEVADCNEWFSTSLVETLVENGFALQHSPLATSALGGKGMGLVTEFGVDTAAFGPRNDIGAKFPPLAVIPRIELGYQYGSYTYDAPYPQVAAGLYVTPMRGLPGLSVWSLGGSLSGAYPINQLLWVGAEVDYGYSILEAGFFDDPDDLTGFDELDTYADLDEVDCLGCPDQLTQDVFGMRLGLSLEPIPALFTYTRFGLNRSSLEFVQGLDGTTWEIKDWRAHIHGGVGARAGDRLQLSAGVVTEPKPALWTIDGQRWMTKIQSSVSVRLGSPRYWKHNQDDAGDDLPEGVETEPGSASE